MRYTKIQMFVVLGIVLLAQSALARINEHKEYYRCPLKWSNTLLGNQIDFTLVGQRIVDKKDPLKVYTSISDDSRTEGRFTVNSDGEVISPHYRLECIYNKVKNGSRGGYVSYYLAGDREGDVTDEFAASWNNVNEEGDHLLNDQFFQQNAGLEKLHLMNITDCNKFSISGDVIAASEGERLPNTVVGKLTYKYGIGERGEAMPQTLNSTPAAGEDGGVSVNVIKEKLQGFSTKINSRRKYNSYPFFFQARTNKSFYAQASELRILQSSDRKLDIFSCEAVVKVENLEGFIEPNLPDDSRGLSTRMYTEAMIGVDSGNETNVKRLIVPISQVSYTFSFTNQIRPVDYSEYD